MDLMGNDSDGDMDRPDTTRIAKGLCNIQKIGISSLTDLSPNRVEEAQTVPQVYLPWN